MSKETFCMLLLSEQDLFSAPLSNLLVNQNILILRTLGNYHPTVVICASHCFIGKTYFKRELPRGKSLKQWLKLLSSTVVV